MQTRRHKYAGRRMAYEWVNGMDSLMGVAMFGHTVSEVGLFEEGKGRWVGLRWLSQSSSAQTSSRR
jgi:hypothetical protein